MEEEKKVPEDNKSKDIPEEKKSNKTLLLVEAGVALLAVIVILVAVIVNKKKEPATTVTDPATGLDPAVTTALADPAATAADVDNNAVFAYIPQFPAETSVNPISEEEALARVADNSMIRLDGEDGNYVYVNNFENKELLDAVLSFDDAELDQYIKNEILAVYQVKLPVDRDTAELGDLANIDYCGVKDGVAFEGGTAQGYDLLLGSGSFIPGFEDGVVGMKIGETKDIPLTFPENYGNAELAGAEVVFTVTLNALTTEGFASELTDDVAKQLTDDEYPTSADFREYIRTDYLPMVRLNEFLLKDLYVSNMNEETLKAQYDTEVNQYIETASMYGMNLETYVSMMGEGTLSDFLDDIANSAPDTVRAEALYRALIKNKIPAITDDEIAAFAAEQGYDDPSVFIETYGRDAISDYLQSLKLDDYLNEIAGIPAD